MIAFLPDSGKSLPGHTSIEGHVRELAVRYNRAVVQAAVAFNYLVEP